MKTLDSVLVANAKKLVGLHPRVAADAHSLIVTMYLKGIEIRITDGYRSIAEQNQLYAQGRTKPGKVVTNAKGGTSNHNYGLAFDFCLVLPDGKTCVWDQLIDSNRDQSHDWAQVVNEAKKLGLAWGGDFKSIYDPPHFEKMFGLTISQLQKGVAPVVMDKEAGQTIIKILQALWGQAKDKGSKDEYHNLANAVRLAIGEKQQ